MFVNVLATIKFCFKLVIRLLDTSTVPVPVGVSTTELLPDAALNIKLAVLDVNEGDTNAEVVILPVACIKPPTYTLPETPTPPFATIAPVEVELESGVKLLNVTIVALFARFRTVKVSD